MLRCPHGCAALRRAAAPSPRPLPRSSSAPPLALAGRRGGSRSVSLLTPARRGLTTASGANAAYLEDLYWQWRRDPALVEPSWRAYFASLSPAASLDAAPPSGAAPVACPSGEEQLQSVIRDHAKVLMLIRAYQVRGHLLADLDPLRLDAATSSSASRSAPPPPECDPAYYGFGEADMDRRFFIGTGALQGFLGQGLGQGGTLTLREILGKLRSAYCGHVGIEYMHIANREQCDWIRARIEREQPPFSAAEKRHVLERLAWATRFESFLALKHGKAEKRFGLEGCEALVPGMKTLIDVAVELGLGHVVIGMAHRGRLNVLANVLRKPLESIFAEFKGFTGQAYGSGDVKYHLGMSVERPTVSGKRVHLSLVANPSHLEAVNPVVEGKTRAKQFYLGDEQRSQVMSVLLHGDAAFAGQGVVYETMGFSDLHDYTTGGTVHIIINNQIGFTADPRQSRSSPYCSDLAKALQAPIFHVNADDPEAVVRVMGLAAEWRQRFKKDVVVDLICYRRHGHNEGDEPSFTQPLMYQRIQQHPPTLDLYSQRLLAEGVVSAADLEKMHAEIGRILEEAHAKIKKEAAGSHSSTASEWLQTGQWSQLRAPGSGLNLATTAVPTAQLRALGLALSRYPADLTLHPALVRTMQARQRTLEEGKGIDWATAEALAFGSLLDEGFHVRLSGQDVERGTFSQRHAVLVDQRTGRRYYPLNNVRPGQAAFSVSNSSLSEFGVLGFELGYSMESPRSLVVWEAQFGDFANGAQVVVDQFITAGEKKWMRQSGLTILLPHGYEGQGPEHSSARLERFLQQTDEEEDVFRADHARQLAEVNMYVANATLPANYFHLLRGQLARPYRKPLVIMTPKSLLRLKEPRGGCTSALEDFGPGTAFRPVIGEQFPLSVPDAKVRKLVLCSGKVYYDLLRHKVETVLAGGNKPDDVALVRLEMLAPFPFAEVAAQLAKYSAAQLVWCQEEPKNMGAWAHVAPRIRTAQAHLGDARPLAYAGRPPAAATATGFKLAHVAEESALKAQAFQ